MRSHVCKMLRFTWRAIQVRCRSLGGISARIAIDTGGDISYRLRCASRCCRSRPGADTGSWGIV
jgi:hypothetical protein